MRAAIVGETILLGAVTGLRSMSGAAALAHRDSSAVQGVTAALALGEMLADKTPYVGDRIAPLPLAGRALMGGVVGGMIAHEERGNVAAGALIGAGAAVLAAHAAFRLRRRVPLPNPLAGLLEDLLVFGVSAFVARRHAA